MWRTAQKELDSYASSSASCVIATDHPADFAKGVALLFGKDADEWIPLGNSMSLSVRSSYLRLAGNDRVDVVEDDETRTIKRTAICSGTQLRVHFEQPLFDERLQNETDNFFLAFSREHCEIEDSEKWQHVVRHIPYTRSTQRQTLLAWIHAKCDHKDDVLGAEAMHALWEYVVDRDDLEEIGKNTLAHVAHSLESENQEV